MVENHQAIGMFDGNGGNGDRELVNRSDHLFSTFGEMSSPTNGY